MDDGPRIVGGVIGEEGMFLRGEEAGRKVE